MHQNQSTNMIDEKAKRAISDLNVAANLQPSAN